MQPRPSANDLHDAQALAHVLYSQCAELSGPYEVASRNLKALHDTLEDIPVVFNAIQASPQVAALRKAFSECVRVLNAIDHALEYQDRQPLADNAANVKFTARIEVATKKLLGAYELARDALESKALYNHNAKSSLNPPIASSIRSELDGATSTMSSLQPFDFTPQSVTAASNLDIRPSGQAAPNTVVEQTVMRPRSTKDLTRLAPVALDSWKTPFAMADPMSSDIETASYLILTGDAVASPHTNIPSIQRDQERDATMDTKAPICWLRNTSTAPTLSSHESKAAPIAMDISTVYPVSIALARPASSSSQQLSSTNRHGSIPRSHRAILSSKSADSVSATTTQPEPLSPSNQELYQEPDSKPKYRVVNADPQDESSDDASEESEVSNEHPESKAPQVPRKNSRRGLGNGSLLIAHKRMARVFSPDCSDSVDSKSEDSRSMQTSMHSRTSSQNSESKSADYIAPPFAGSYTDTECKALIVQTWNRGDMDQAELHLQGLLHHRLHSTPSDVHRRVRHLLGVITSLKGKWEQALEHFVSALNAPLVDVAHLDAGDCAAAYWMGDIYTLFNRRVEALIAYSVVELCLAERKKGSTNLRQQLLRRVQAEQKLCRKGNDKTYFELHLDKIMQYDDPAGADSILKPNVMTRETAQSFLERVKWSPDSSRPAEQNQSRAMALCSLDPNSATGHSLRLEVSALESSTPWPMPFDPLFASANVACGLPLSSARDLLQLKDIPRTSGALGRNRMNCFTCQDLHWLFTTLRACMGRLELKYTEATNSTGTWVIPQYSSTDGLIASTNFILISIFRLTFRSGYGVEICPGGIFSSRITKIEEKEKGGEKAGQAHELKRIKKLIRSYMDAALKRQEAIEERNTVIPVMSINGVTSIHRGIRSPSKGKKPESESSSSPATSSRAGSMFN